MVDKISKCIFLLIVILSVASVSAAYYRFVVLDDFEIINDLEEEDYEIIEEESL